jgi:glycosyltransferase involved in cell wall biosynthesis
MAYQLERLRVMRIIARMNVGGPALQAVTLMRGLPADRFEQRLYAGLVEAGEADYISLRAPGLVAHRVPALGRRVRLGDDAHALTALTAEMRRFRPHIVHTHTAKAGTLGRIAAILARVPGRVHTFHGHLLHGYFRPGKARLVVDAERVLARHTDRLIAVGARVRDDLLAAGVGRPGQYVVIPPGTRLGPLPDRRAARRELGLPARGPVVAYVGRLTRVKRPDRLAAVAREVIRAVPDARFAVCGDGDLAADVGSAARDLGPAMRLLGWRADVETVYAAADVVLLTSDNEGMPVSLIEAGLAGVPAVATNVGSVAEVVRDRSTGLLATHDVGELARSVVRLLRDDALHQRMGAAAAAWCQEQFGPERLVGDVERLYEDIAMERGWWPRSTPTACSPPMPERVADRRETGSMQVPGSHRVAR